jgi:hypothetical protein
MNRQLFELGQVQAGDGNEVGRRSEPPCGALGLLQQAVNGLDESVRSVADHSRYDRLGALRIILASYLNGSSRHRLAQIN